MITTNRMGAIALGVSGLLFLGAAQAPNVCRLSKREAPNKGTTIIARATFDPNQPNKSLIYFAAALGNAGVAALLWGKKEQRQNIAVNPALEPAPMPALAAGADDLKEIPDSLPEWNPMKKLFDWNELDKCVHIMYLGPTGVGKSLTAQWGLTRLRGSAVVIDPHAKPSSWPGLRVIGGGRNYAQIADFLSRLVAFMDYRYKLRDSGYPERAMQMVNVLIDEYPAIASSDECSKIAPSALKKLVREARKVNIRLIVLSQGAEVKALGIEGEGSLRECFDFVRLGSMATDYARKLSVEAQQDLKRLDRPCLVEDKVAPLPDLSSYTPNLSHFQPLPEELEPEEIYTDRKLSEVNPSEGSGDFDALTSDLQEPDKALYLAITAAMEAGKSKSWITENVLGCKGRKFKEGQQLLEKLLAKYGANKDDDSYFISPMPM